MIVPDTYNKVIDYKEYITLLHYRNYSIHSEAKDRAKNEKEYYVNK